MDHSLPHSSSSSPPLPSPSNLLASIFFPYSLHSSSSSHLFPSTLLSSFLTSSAITSNHLLFTLIFCHLPSSLSFLSSSLIPPPSLSPIYLFHTILSPLLVSFSPSLSLLLFFLSYFLLLFILLFLFISPPSLFSFPFNHLSYFLPVFLFSFLPPSFLLFHLSYSLFIYHPQSSYFLFSFSSFLLPSLVPIPFPFIIFPISFLSFFLLHFAYPFFPIPL